MNKLSTITAVVVCIFGLQAAAKADTILLSSYATGAINPGASNTATFYVPTASTVNNGVDTTYNVSPGTTWHPAIGNSSYVSYNPNTAPGGSVVAPNGDYVYRSYFDLSAMQAASSTGTMTVLADDTVAITLNGNLILAAAGPMGPADAYSHCAETGPNCLTPTTFNFAGLVAGQNVLTFDVKQVNLVNEGLDYSGAISAVAVPEPASIALLGSGLLSIAGFYRRRLNLS